MGTLILIRGNSGSGKTTVASELHRVLSGRSLLISQDYVRRVMLNVKDTPMNPAIDLIELMIGYGLDHCDYTIVEGILNEERYGAMLRQIIKQNQGKSLVYYYDLSLEATIHRHLSKTNPGFDAEKLADWFVPHDYLGVDNEFIITENMSKTATVNKILADLRPWGSLS